jgi:hypothetical protein
MQGRGGDEEMSEERREERRGELSGWAIGRCCVYDVRCSDAGRIPGYEWT